MVLDAVAGQSRDSLLERASELAEDSRISGWRNGQVYQEHDLEGLLAEWWDGPEGGLTLHVAPAGWHRHGIVWVPVLPRRRKHWRPKATASGTRLRSGLHRKRAGSPDNPAESSSLTWRTGHSSPDAPHPASRRRRFGQRQAGELLPEEDLHLSVHVHSPTRPAWAAGTQTFRHDILIQPRTVSS